MKRFFLVSVLLIISLLCISCKKKDYSTYFQDAETLEETEVTTHKWYSFTANNFVQIQKPEFAIATPFVPWTEAVRISSANSCKTGAYGVVNRLGILTFDGDNVSLTRDVSVFSNRTAGNLVFIDDVPIFSVYKSSFFNDTIKTPEYKFDKSQHYFLVQYDLKSKICYPVINCNNLVEPPESEVIDFVWDGMNWLCNVKNISDGKIRFLYLSWLPTVSLPSLSPVSASTGISVVEADEDTFRESKKIEPYEFAPGRIKKLLDSLSQKVPFTVEVKKWNSGSPKKYRNSKGSPAMQDLIAQAMVTEGWSGVLFQDGTFFFEGYLPGLHILRGGKPVVLRLPKLPAGFSYSDFVISDKTLYAAWEETSFYKTSRSGFISVNLEKTLYNTLR